MNVLAFAHEIIDMQRRIEHLEAENMELLRYREEYFDLLNGNIEHSREMMGGMLRLALTPGVMEACAAANAGE
jgi:xylose isomerase